MPKYLELSDPIYDTITELILKSYPHSCIVWIETIHNKTLVENFERQKENIGTPTILKLFHGTTHENIDSICKKWISKKI